ncbi:hypothetical protein Smp_169420 [Schistosoma mansoni]|uniref:hypothetical protein n=1 Tax=Schistosoma mansoni TaxID=6183 RepID=UPI00022C839A|nr:hypothetical protein Smp_169420 [Schistosoma mansoni]|eukprot:XP_018646081.1 hypothetical protein Smp_169420 [Schistosoma mansoni]
MLHVYDTNNDDNSGHPKPSRKNQLNCHGIFVTNEDLNNSLQTLSSSVGSQKIYLKPLPNENDMLNSRKLNDKKRLPKVGFIFFIDLLLFHFYLHKETRLYTNCKITNF